MRDIVTDIFDSDVINSLKSSRLKALVSIQKNKKDKNNLFPDYGHLLEDFKSMIQWKAVGTKKVPEPTPGQDPDFDRANAKVDGIKDKLDKYLEKIRKNLKSKHVTYTTNSKRFRYELEMPEDMHKLLDSDVFINTSNAKGRRRYQTDELRDIINELEEAEEGFKDALIPFLRVMFKKFYDNKEILTTAVNCVAELDCLCALAVVSASTEYGSMTRPTILE